VGLAYVQALDRSTARHAGRKRSDRLALHRRHPVDARVMGRAEFTGAARFLRHVVSHLQTASLADLQQEDLGRFEQALCAFENIQTRLRKELHDVLPALRKTSPVRQSQSRTERIVCAVLDRVQQHYAQPLTLQKCAGDLRVNAAYLSHLFSHLIGLPFKTCLTEVRVEKARELLGDSAKNISQVASAVGYASANRFRLAFKNVTGLSPRMWRETLQMNPPPTGSST
jgi:YesN/AraC family two-component response regulator